MVNYEIIVNPDNEKYWNSLYKLVIEQEKWFNKPEDYEIWRKGFGDNFRMFFAINKDTDEVIGSSCAADYRDHDGNEFLTASGMLFVDEKYRGHGIGMALAKKFSEGYPNRSLIAVQSMSPKYAKGFGYDKIPEDNMTDIEFSLSKLDRSIDLPLIEGVTIRKSENSDWPEILAYDRKLIKYTERDNFIKRFCTQPNSVHMIAIDDKSNKILGICLIRSNAEMRLHYAGPVYAETPEIAEHLFFKALDAIEDTQPSDKIRLAFYRTSKTLDMLKKHIPEEDIEKSNHFLQFTKEIIKLPTEYIYGITENDVTYM